MTQTKTIAVNIALLSAVGLALEIQRAGGTSEAQAGHDNVIHLRPGQSITLRAVEPKRGDKAALDAGGASDGQVSPALAEGLTQSDERSAAAQQGGPEGKAKPAEPAPANTAVVRDTGATQTRKSR